MKIFKSMRRLSPVLFGLGLAIGPNTAGATLLYAGGEDIDFFCGSGSTCYVNTSGAPFYRPAWAREAYGVFGTTSDPPTNRFATSAFASASTVWLHAQYCTSYAGSSCQNVTTANDQMVRLIDTNGNAALVVRGTGNAGQVKISSRTAAGVFTDLVTCSAAINAALTQLDLYVNYGSSGEVALYTNSVQVCDYSGNVTNGDGASTLAQVEFASPMTGTTVSSAGMWSEVIIATTDTRAMARFTANTSGNGNATGFSGTNVCSAIWNVTSANDASYGYTGSNTVLHECTINSSIPAGNYNVLGLVMSARTLVGSSGPLHFDFLTRVGGTDYASSDFAPTTSFSNIVNYIQAVNPATASPWSVSDFQAAGFNVGEESKP